MTIPINNAPVMRFFSACLAPLTVTLCLGCGEEAVQGKPAVGYGVAVPEKISPINNQLPSPEPLEVPAGANTE